MTALTGLHHVTAIATDPQRNADFCCDVLGLRLVKTTVNFDAPGSYHLYFGNEAGDPGTLLTFFPWPGVPRGRRGAGQVTSVAFSVPEGSLGWWRERLSGMRVEVAEAAPRPDGEAVRLSDPDGLQLELVAGPDADARPPWETGPVPPEQAIRGLDSVTLTEAGYESTAALLTGHLRFRLGQESGSRFRFVTGDGGPGARVDVVCAPEAPRGLVAAGTVHHVAWRAPDDTAQLAWRDRLAGGGRNVTPVLDRRYFRSIYFREPGGVLFEIATDPPGFTVDEPLTELGRALRLPPWLEPDRARIEAGLPPLTPPGPGERLTLGGTRAGGGPEARGAS